MTDGGAAGETDKQIKTAEVFIHPHQRLTNITIVAAIYGLIGSVGAR